MGPYAVIDFETKPIRRRPDYPPEPVGVAVLRPGSAEQYFGWGHAVGNNCSRRDAQAALDDILKSGVALVFHNAKFDLAVLTERMSFPMPEWSRVHDSMFLAYLCDPHARSLGLKPLAEDLLGWPDTERSHLDEWIWEHRHELAAAYGGKVKRNALGEWIWAAPGDLVGHYAIGDVERTAALFDHLMPLVQNNGMGRAYDRERELLPILMENERVGVRVDVSALERDVEAYSNAMRRAEDWLRRELCASGLNFDADRDVANVLLQRGVVAEDRWRRTVSGQLSVSKETLTPDCFSDRRIASALGYRNRLKTCLKMFMAPWLEHAVGGYVSTTWNQVRGDRGGTRTGRPSTTDPNFLNISKDFEDKKSDGYIHPRHLDVPALPLVRKYILPDPGGAFLHRDFDGQEIRVFAHFEQGALLEAYLANQALDVHEWIKTKIIEQTGVELERTRVKNVTFARLYGGGIPAIMRQAKCRDRAEAQAIANYHDAALPGRLVLVQEIERLARRGEPIRTWGGRLYWPEPPGPDGLSKTYKLINYLVQGSAADLTKQTLIDWFKHPKRNARFLVTVYDEINVSAPRDDAERQMKVLRDVMEAPRLATPMRTSGKRGATWGDLEKCP